MFKININDLDTFKNVSEETSEKLETAESEIASLQEQIQK